MNSGKVLHVIPDSVMVQKDTYLGSTKDIRGRTEYFRARGIPFEEFVVRNRSDMFLLEKLGSMDLEDFHAIIFELALYPRSMRYVRARFPGIKLITRSINADFYHWLHYFWVSYKNSPDRFSKDTRNTSVKYLRNAMNRLWLDFICAHLSDAVLTIVDWEKENYWSFLISAGKIKTLPYFLPDEYSTKVIEVAKKALCVCLMSTGARTVPLLQDALLNFNSLVEQLGEDCAEWRFLVTGDLSKQAIEISSRVELTGFMESPFPLLAESRAMALLSNYGFGFKTKILDAIYAGCHVLVPEGLYDRLPEEIRPYCTVVHLRSVQSFRDALEKTKEPLPQGNPNARLKERAFSVLDELILT